MSWTDKASLRVIRRLRDAYNIEDFVETGTFKGINALTQSDHFKRVLTCEKEKKYYEIAKDKLRNCPNVSVFNVQSKEFLRGYIANRIAQDRRDIPFIYLDAHFYDAGRWVVKTELKELKGFGHCVIAIHDFDNGLGHIVYDGQQLNWEVVRGLKDVGNFFYYTNTEDGCDIMKPEETNDPEAKDNLKYAWSKPDKGKRGILYAVPTKLKDSFGLVEWNSD